MKLLDRVAFDVIGRPQQKGSKRAFSTPRAGGGVNVHVRDSNVNAAPWAATVAAKAAEAHTGELLRGPVRVWLTFRFKRPKSHYGTGRNAQALKPSAPYQMTSMPDVDKLARCTLDALTGTVIGDDAQVVELVACKCYGEPERVEVRIEEGEP